LFVVLLIRAPSYLEVGASGKPGAIHQCHFSYKHKDPHPHDRGTIKPGSDFKRHVGQFYCGANNIVGEEVFLAVVNAALGLSLTVRPEDRAAGGASKVVAAAAKRLGVQMPDGWKVTAILHLVREWAEGRGTPTGDAMQRAAILFRALRTRFEKS
jgi:hypothetical protein